MQTAPFYTRFFYWGKLIALTGTAQAAIQALGLLTGILIIQLLPVKEYAYYTIANTVLATMALLADSGINNGVMAYGGQVWQDRGQLGAVVATAMRLRRTFSLVSLCISVPVLLALLLRQGAGWPASLLITTALIPAFVATLTDSILEIPFKLHQQIRTLQVNQLQVAVGRFFMAIGALFFLPWAFIPLLANGLPRLWGNYRLRNALTSLARPRAETDAAVKSGMIGIVKRTLPLTIYYAYSGQLAVWIISITGSSFAVAQIGALGRISMALSLFSVLFASLVTPRFARLPGSRKVMFRRFVQILILLLGLTSFIMLGSWLFAARILMLLGPQYANLDSGLMLSLLAACISLVSGSVYGLYSSRGWAVKPLWPISANLLVIAACALTLNLSTLEGVLTFNVLSACGQLLVSLLFCFYKIIRTPAVNQPML